MEQKLTAKIHFKSTDQKPDEYGNIDREIIKKDGTSHFIRNTDFAEIDLVVKSEEDVYNQIKSLFEQNDIDWVGFKYIKDYSEMTFGEKLVGLNFNPSMDNQVDQVKETFAGLADIVMATEQGNGVDGYLYNTIKGDCIRQILHTQMACVKLITLK